ncbi:hypothetical protein [Mycolicibacterium conceptionense]|uniref:hypothetical protein n=1 Tax=Mycolicibacterium conceptionense TaxID=451644 RepID=UPI003204F195
MTYTDARPAPQAELLVIAGCPHRTLTEALVRVMLDQLGLGHIAVRTSVIDTPAEALRLGFSGSPTILIDGIDPWLPRRPQPAIACRLYPTTDGLPDRQELAAALHAAAVTTPRRQSPQTA